MRLFFYYSVHSFVNQIRKLFKTWMLIFLLACILLGGGIGFITGSLIAESENNAAVMEEITEDEPEYEFVFEENLDTVELVAGAIVFGILLLSVFGADENGGKLFQPADVSILFSSPMKPQSVLLFRLVTRLGFVLFMCVFYLIEVPTFADSGIPTYAIFLVYALVLAALVYGQILRALLYIECQNHPGMRKYYTPVIYGIITLVLVAFLAFWKSADLAPLEAAKEFFGRKWMDFIPVWGWTRAFYMSFVSGDTLGGLIWIALEIAGICALFAVTMRTKADFYEDAMTKAEETAALLRDAAEKGRLFTSKRKKDRTDRVTRDSISHGKGATVYFFTQMYNRRRFAKFGVFTKTSVVYLFSAMVLSVILKEVAGNENYMIVALMLGVMVFFRALGNPLERDVSTPYFILIPDSTWKKLFCSIAGSTVNCLLDLLPGMLAAGIMLHANLILIPVWMLFIATVDYYSSCVGAFIGLSTPVSVGKNVKNIIQIMFLYFGLVPDAALIVAGIINGHTASFVAAASLVNMLLGFIFMSISTNFIAPKGGNFVSTREPLTSVELKKAKAAFSRIGFMPVIILALSVAFSFVLALAAEKINPDIYNSSWFFWVMSFGPLFLIFDPIGYLSVRKMEVLRKPPDRLRIGVILRGFFICEFFMISANLLTQLIMSVVSSIVGMESVNAVSSVMLSNDIGWQIAAVVICGPIAEELLFRKVIIDRLSVYGEKKAVLMSALAFGLFHGNWYQFLYAFLIGLVLGYIYVRMRNVKITVLIHVLINFCGSVVPSYLMSHIDLTALENADLMGMTDAEALHTLFSAGFVSYGIYLVFLLAAVILGIVFFFREIFEIRFTEAPKEIQKGEGFKVCCLNPGMIVLTAVAFLFATYSAWFAY